MTKKLSPFLKKKIKNQARIINVIIEKRDFEEVVKKFKEYFVRKSDGRRTSYGTPWEGLHLVGRELGKKAQENLYLYIPIAKKLWMEGGEEGRVAMASTLGAMELVNPIKIFPVITELVQHCRSWNECDNMAQGYEKIFLKYPYKYLHQLEKNMKHENRWVKRLAINVVGRLMMNYPDLTERCLKIIEPAFTIDVKEIKMACSYVIGTFGVRADQKALADFIVKYKDSKDSNLIWIMCDAIRRSKQPFSGDFLRKVIPIFGLWQKNISDEKIQKSVEIAVKKLEK